MWTTGKCLKQLSGMKMFNEFEYRFMWCDCRCIIPECDNLNHPEYNADWIGNAIPITNSKPSKCYRYESLSPEPSYGTKLYFDHFGKANDNQFCSKDLFNQSNIVKCNEGGLVYKTNEISIVNEVFFVLPQLQRAHSLNY
jgi:hypothetical protein